MNSKRVTQKSLLDLGYDTSASRVSVEGSARGVGKQRRNCLMKSQNQIDVETVVPVKLKQIKLEYI